MERVFVLVLIIIIIMIIFILRIIIIFLWHMRNEHLLCTLMYQSKFFIPGNIIIINIIIIII